MFALVWTIASIAAQAAPNAVTFGGNTLQQLRSGSTGVDRFAEYGRRDDKVSEMLTVRSLSDKAPFKAQVQKLVASIEKAKTLGKISVLQRSGRDDVLISYLDDRGAHVRLVLWRLAALDERVVTASYQMDFDIHDENARDRIKALVAERALVTFAPADIARLVADEN